MLRTLVRGRFEQVVANEAVHARRPDGVLRTQEWRDLEQKGLFLEPLQKVLRATGHKRLNHLEKCLLLNFVSGTVPTADYLANKGYAISDGCPFCRRAPDSVFHRVFVCSSRAVLRAELFQAGVVEEATRLGSMSLWVSRGWFPNPDISGPADQTIRYYCRGVEVDPVTFHGFDTDGGPVYLDGSCLYPHSRTLARAGASVVQMSGSEVTRAVKANLPKGLAQNAALAEHYSFLLASLSSAQAVVAVADCNSVVVAAECGPSFSHAPSKTYAGLWKVNHHPLVVRKTKAHRTQAEALAQDDAADFFGNQAADRLAKEAAVDALPPEVELRAAFNAIAKAMAFYRAVAKMLASFPPARDIWGKLARARCPAKPARREHGDRHSFVWHLVHNRWVCTVCRRTKLRSRSVVDRTPCSQPAPRIRQMLVGGHGTHVTFTAPCPGGDLFFCRRCGCHATTRPRALLAPCKPLDAHGRYNLGRIADRLHPYTGVPIGRPVHVVIGALRRALGSLAELLVGSPPAGSPGVHPSRGVKRRR